MATKPLKSLKFPTLDDTYTVPQVDDTLAVQGAAADAKKVGDELTDLKGDINEKASSNGTYENMTAGNAEQLLSDEYAEDKIPYLFRQSGGGVDVGDRAEDTIVGGTVAWNQLMPTLTSNNYSVANGSPSYADGKLTIDVTSVTNWIGITKSPAFTIAGHKYFVSATITSPKAINFSPNASATEQSPMTIAGKATTVATLRNADGESTVCMYLRASAAGCEVGDDIVVENLMYVDLTQMFGTTIADYIYALETATAGAGVEFFRKLFPKPYYPYDAGTLKHVEGLVSHDCVGFNQWDEEWEVGNITNSGGNGGSTDRIRSKNYIPVIPGLMYHAKIPSNTFIRVAFYDAQKAFISLSDLSTQPITFAIPDTCGYIRFNLGTDYGTTYKNDVCINLSSSKNGTYEPYTKHSYPLDSTLTLRGIPKLDASNNLYFDGDVYAPDGTVTRRYGIVDLGTLTWTYAADGDNKYFRTESVTDGKTGASIGITPVFYMCSKYLAVSPRVTAEIADKQLSRTINANSIFFVKDSAYTDAATFKSAMSGVYMVYELQTPTTEEASPFQTPQIVDKYGTEEYVIDDSITVPVPVGHDTKYPVNLKAKIEGLPWNFATLIAPTEASYTASRAYTTGQLFIVNNILYQATANIANGGAITPNTNCTATTLAEVISAL